MEPDFSKIFHQSSKNHQKGHPQIPADSNEWPDEWKTTYYKSYPRLPKVEFEDETSSADLRGLHADQRGSKANFFQLIQKRQSRRNFTRGAITKQELSLILKYSCGNTGQMGEGRHHRAQPSGGGRFPIEVYPIVFRSESREVELPQGSSTSASDGDLPAGLYHYNVKDHQLDVLWDREFTPTPERGSSTESAAGANPRLVRGFSDEDIGSIFTYPWVKNAACAIVMTSVFWRNQNKYGERGYRYILLEAGHIGQNVYLASEALGLKCCALGGTRDENLEKLLDIDGVTESVVYALAVGK